LGLHTPSVPRGEFPSQEVKSFHTNRPFEENETSPKLRLPNTKRFLGKGNPLGLNYASLLGEKVSSTGLGHQQGGIRAVYSHRKTIWASGYPISQRTENAENNVFSRKRGKRSRSPGDPWEDLPPQQKEEWGHISNKGGVYTHPQNGGPTRLPQTKTGENRRRTSPPQQRTNPGQGSPREEGGTTGVIWQQRRK